MMMNISIRLCFNFVEQEDSMIFVKKVATILLHYVLAIFIANLVVGALSLLFKIFLITVQGPAIVSRLSEIATYYISLSFAFFFLFRSYA